jgi:urease accessory protein
MSIPKSPFNPSTSSPGIGNIRLATLPPQKQILKIFDYQYPLKLIAPDPYTSPGSSHHTVTSVFLLTYGGGLVGGDKISLNVTLEENTRLVLVTQGSTKIFKSPARSVVSAQTLNVKIAKNASLCYLPDPTQPFAESVYEQKQTFFVDPLGTSSLCILDWVSEGRRARGESWTLWSWKGRNEVRELPQEKSKPSRLLLRDAVMLSDNCGDGVPLGAGIVDKTDGLGVFGTLILYGPTFQALSLFFLDEFKNQPRIGAKNWSDGKSQKPISEEASKQERRSEQEKANGLLWTAANIRGFVVVKFGAREIGGARQWIGDMIRHQGSLEENFGHQALIGLR